MSRNDLNGWTSVAMTWNEILYGLDLQRSPIFTFIAFHYCLLSAWLLVSAVKPYGSNRLEKHCATNARI
jgi:hypothetical protein